MTRLGNNYESGTQLVTPSVNRKGSCAAPATYRPYHQPSPDITRRHQRGAIARNNTSKCNEPTEIETDRIQPRENAKMPTYQPESSAEERTQETQVNWVGVVTFPKVRSSGLYCLTQLTSAPHTSHRTTAAHDVKTDTDKPLRSTSKQ